MNVNSKFFKRSFDVAAKFLHTAVVIDDRAFVASATEVQPAPSVLVPPPTPTTSKPIVDQLPEASPPIKEQPAAITAPTALDNKVEATSPDPDPHGINAEEVIDSFARHGIICSVLRREPDEDFTSPSHRAQLLLGAADILVVDWQVHHRDGTPSLEETLQFIESAVRENVASSPRQLRLIVIYTGALDLNIVSENVFNRLEPIGQNVVKDGEFSFRAGALRIVVLGKPSNYRATDQRMQQLNDDSELCERAIKEFTVMTSGLVSNVALESLAEVRRATHQILTRFGSVLDAPFLAHRALLHHPSEGNSHLLPLIVAEIEAILEDRLSDVLLSDECIQDWLEIRPDPFEMIKSPPGIHDSATARQAVQDICLKGVSAHGSFSVPDEPAWIKKLASEKSKSELEKLTQIIAGEAVGVAYERLELLMSLRPRYSDAAPMLALGTLVRSPARVVDASAPAIEDSREYWLCLQPACDCYIRGSVSVRAFPLLRLELPKDRFNLIAEQGGHYIRLLWSAKPYRVKMFEFEANSPHGAVLAVLDNGEYWFRSSDNTSRFEWVAQLKFPQAQRIAQLLASEAGRVGLTESEWLRRNAK